jgi:amidohydrolase
MTPRAHVAAVLDDLPAVRGWQEDLYRDLHEHPELSNQEHRTAAIVAERLRDAGYDVHSGVGGTGVVGVLRNGDGPTVLLRADMDALPVKEATGLPYASTVRSTDGAGNDVPVAHACGHDAHVTCLLGAAALLAQHTGEWAGSLVALFQPAEELGRGAAQMVEDGLAELIPPVDVALAQHVGPGPAGFVGMRSGPTLASADSLRVTVYGRGSHGSMPQHSIDPVVLAAMIVLRLQTIVSREVDPAQTAVVTVGSIRAGSKSNVIGDHAVLEINVRTYDDAVRTTVLAAIRRIVAAECQASGCTREPDFDHYDQFSATVNDDTSTGRVADAFTDHFGDWFQEIPPVTASEDFGDIPAALGAPGTYWFVGCVEAERYAKAAAAGRMSQDIPVNHAPEFAPVLQPTLDVGTTALVVAAIAWLGLDGR